MNYHLTAEAEQDLKEIFDFGVYKFGSTQAGQYTERLVEAIELLVLNSEMGKARKDIHLSLRSLIVASHSIFYEILKNEILIVRILHHSRDVKNQL